LLWVSLAFLSGIVLNRFLHAPLAVWLIITVIRSLMRYFSAEDLAVWQSSMSGWRRLCIALLLGASVTSRPSTK